MKTARRTTGAHLPKTQTLLLVFDAGVVQNYQHLYTLGCEGSETMVGHTIIFSIINI